MAVVNSTYLASQNLIVVDLTKNLSNIIVTVIQYLSFLHKSKPFLLKNDFNINLFIKKLIIKQ